MTADEHFDAVIVGSGFGGAVCAYRLAEADMNVCLLERGNIYPPGSFPRTRSRMSRNFWDPSEGYYGLFNIWSFRGIEAIVSSGLGGGSLIFANVLIRKPESWFVQHHSYQGASEHWPITYEQLLPHYERVEQMLNVQKYPYEQAPYDKTSKTGALREAAAQLGLHWELPNLGVIFSNPGQDALPGQPIPPSKADLHQEPRYTCLLCGECDIGCNYGSKNTLDHNYLAKAKHMKADLRHLCEVRSFAPLSDHSGYEIFYVEHDLAREGKKTNTKALVQKRITARRLILCAGTLGTTYLLLKNRSVFPRISRRLGEGFCGNGDLLSFAVRAATDSDPATKRELDPTRGPVITSTIVAKDEVDGGEGRGYYIQDAGFPTFVTWTLEAASIPRVILRSLRYIMRRLRHVLTGRIESDLGAEVAELFTDSTLFSSSLPLLGMGRDVPDGSMRLRNGYLDVDWKIKTSKKYFKQVSNTMRKIAHSWNARFALFHTNLLRRVITVHPLGGCTMGTDVENGVVNEFGEVFNYPGLYVADGSVMPGPTGANPSLTIAAFADRCAEQIIQQAKAEEKHGES